LAENNEAAVGITKDEDLGLLNNSKRGWFWLFTTRLTAISLIINQTDNKRPKNVDTLSLLCVYTTDN
jgi:hypothetical protein